MAVFEFFGKIFCHHYVGAYVAVDEVKGIPAYDRGHVMGELGVGFEYGKAKLNVGCRAPGKGVIGNKNIIAKQTITAIYINNMVT